jgi:DNA-binding NarL/FixJ family response regulator
MEAFNERTGWELAATGEQVRKRRPENREELTAQEEQIARLARNGLSNPEIGGQLSLRSRTSPDQDQRGYFPGAAQR